MTHEFIHIVTQAASYQKQGIRQVLATVVELDGSSYRKPGVRMLLAENGAMTGAVSGGCVEKEVFRRSLPVFESGEARVMAYDGRYRLGCEGTLFILLEPFTLSDEFLSAFNQKMETRQPFQIQSWFEKEDAAVGPFGSKLTFEDGTFFTFSNNQIKEENLQHFSQSFNPRFKLLIIGAEHDAVKLSSMAALMGWEVEVVSSWKDPKTLADFPGATKVYGVSPENFDLETIDEETAVVLMTHNFSLDLKYLIRLNNLELKYLGVIGSTSRRDRLQEQLMELAPETPYEFFDSIHSPAGLDIGSITPEEIALSILSEILCTVRGRVPNLLKDVTSRIKS